MPIWEGLFQERDGGPDDAWAWAGGIGGRELRMEGWK